ncbi:MAG: hypothetical protein ABI867_10760 [Kofleriaceae bacterium]
MKAVCKSVTERIALGEPLGELGEHVATCEDCTAIVAMPDKLVASRHPVDPGLGFSARMTVGAQHRITARRRQRLAATLAATVAASVVGVVMLTRSPDDPASESRERPALRDPKQDKQEDPPVAAEPSDLATLVRFADTRRARRASAPWGRIQKPLAPYMKLVKGVTP